MTVISALDRDKAKNAKQITLDAVLNVVPLTEFASATVREAPASYPITGIAVEDTSADWNDIEVGMLFSVEREDGTIITWGVVRLPIIPSAIYIDAKSRGDGGYARDIYYEIEDGDTVRVYDVFPAWGLLSRATAQDVYKLWDVTYRGQGSRPEPVCNMGTHQQAYVDPLSGDASFTLDAGQSFDWFNGTSGITAYAWVLPSGMSVASGSTSSASLTVTAPPGVYRVSCTVTSSTGRTTTGHRWLFANVRTDDGSEGVSFGTKYGVSVPSADQQNVQGREVSFECNEDARNALYPGAMCVFTVRTYFDGEELSIGAKTFVGYLNEMTSEATFRERSGTVKFSAPLRYARALPTATQLIQEVPNPIEWTDVVFGLSQPAFYVYYALRYHTTLMSLHDYQYDTGLLQLRRRVLGLSQTNVAGQLEFIGQVMRGFVGCQSDGTLTARMLGDLMENTERNALDEKFTWDEQDIAEPLSVNPTLRPTIAQIILDGISYSGGQFPDTYRAIAPGYAAGQGQGMDDAPDIIVTANEGQDRVERIAGHLFARENNPLQSLNLPLAYPLDILEPADNDWHILNVPANKYLTFTPNRFGVSWNATTRFTPNSVTRQWRRVRGALVLSISVDARITTFGQKGEFLPIDAGDGWNWQSPEGWVSDNRNVYNQDTPEFDVGTGYATLVAWNSYGELAVTENALDERVNWRSARGNAPDNLPGEVLDAVWDYAVASASVYALTKANPTTLQVYRCADITAPTWIQQGADITVTSASFTGKARIRCSDTLIAVAWLSTDGIRVRRKGASWQSDVLVGSAFTDVEASASELDLAVDGNVVHIAGAVATGEYALFTATGQSGSFSQVPNIPANTQRAPTIIQHRSGLSGDRYVTLYRSTNQADVQTITTFLNQTELVPSLTDSANAPNQSAQYGFHSLRQTPVMANGGGYTLTELNASFKTTMWYTPGAASAPDYYPPEGAFYTVPVTLEVALLDSKRRPLWSSGVIRWNSNDAGGTVTYAPTLPSVTRIRYEIEETIAEVFSTPIEGVRYVEYRFQADELRNFNAGEFFQDGLWFSTFAMTGGLTNIKTSELTYDGWRLYRVDGADGWNDITPNDDYVPLRREALARTVTSGTSVIVGENETGTRQLLRTTNTGGSWSALRDTDYIWLKQLGTDAYILGRQNGLDLSVDGLETTHERIGDWAVNIGYVGIIEGALALVETE